MCFGDIDENISILGIFVFIMLYICLDKLELRKYVFY